MRNRLYIVVAAIAASTAALHAQHHATPQSARTASERAALLVDSRHYYGAYSEQLGQHTLSCAHSLISDYHLAIPATEQHIGQWIRHHQTHPLAARLKLLRANLLVGQQRYHEALAIYQSEDECPTLTAEETIETRLCQAVAAIHTGQIERAYALLMSIDGQPLHAPDVQYYLGYVYYRKGEYAKALPYLQTAAVTSDYRASAPLCLAECQLQTDEPADALATIRQWRRQSGRPEFNAEADRVEGEADYALGDYATTVEKLGAYASAQPAPSRTALYKLGISELKQGDYAAAANHLATSAAAERDAMSQSAWLEAGIAYLKSDNIVRARNAFQQATELNFDSHISEEALYNYALSLRDAGDMGFGETSRVYEQFLRQYPTSQHADAISEQLISAYIANRNYDAALKALQRVNRPTAQLNEMKQHVLRALAETAINEGRNTAAVDYMNQSLAVSTTVRDLHLRGEAQYRLHNYAAALQSLQAAVSRADATYADLAGLNYTLGYTLFKQQRYADALPHFITASERSAASPWRADAYSRAADCQFMTKRYDEAYTNYQQAIDLLARQGQSANTAAVDHSLMQQALIEGLRGNNARKLELLGRVSHTQNNETLLVEQMRAAHELGNHQTVIKSATSLIEQLRIDSPLLPEAQMFRAEALLATGNARDAMTDLNALSAQPDSKYGAQAVVMRAQYAFDTAQYQAAEQLLTDFIDRGTSQKYWLARAFIILSDVYARTDRQLEAREYLLSLRSNYTESDEILQMIDERLGN